MYSRLLKTSRYLYNKYLSGAAARTLIERKKRTSKYMKNKKMGIVRNNKNPNERTREREKAQIGNGPQVLVMKKFNITSYMFHTENLWESIHRW